MTEPVVALVLVLVTMVTGQVAAQDSTPMSEQPVTIGGSEITWSGDWTYMVGTSESMSEIVAFSQTNVQTGILKVLTHGRMPSGAETDASGAIETFADSYFEEGGAVDVNEVSAGDLGDGAAWKVYTMNPSESAGITSFGDGPLGSLVLASPDDDGGYIITSLTTNASLLQQSVVQVQHEFVLNGNGQFFEGIDAAATADLPTEETSVAAGEPGATPLASPEITVATSAAATPPGSPEAEPVVCTDGTPALQSAEATLAAVQAGPATGTPAETPGASLTC